MMKMKLIVWVLILLSLVFTTSCNQPEEIKNMVLHAIEKQTEIKSYHFEGSAQIDIDHSLFTNKQTLAKELMQLINKSTLTWSGFAQTQPNLIEMDLKITPMGSTTAMEIPVMMTSEHIYIQLPGINSIGEYTQINIPAEKDNQANSTDLESSVSNSASHIIFALTSILYREAPADWFKLSDMLATTDTEVVAQHITIEHQDPTNRTFTDGFQTPLIPYRDLLAFTGLISDGSSNGTVNLRQLSWSTPSKMVIDIDPQGFISQQTIDVSLALPNEQAENKIIRLKYQQTYDQINQPPSFTKKIPKQILIWDDLLANINKP